MIEPAEVKVQPEAWERTGEERRFEVEITRPQLAKREIVRPNSRMKADRSPAPVPAPARVVWGGHAAAGLRAWVVIAKDLDHLAPRGKRNGSRVVRDGGGHAARRNQRADARESRARRAGGTVTAHVIEAQGENPKAVRVASGYLLAQWTPHSRHLAHGLTRLDNNLVENAIRPTAVGRKNWPFGDHPDTGGRAAILHSLISSCLRHGQDLAACPRDGLSRQPATTTRDDLDAPTPRRWQPASLSAASGAPRPGNLASVFGCQGGPRPFANVSFPRSANLVSGAQPTRCRRRLTSRSCAGRVGSGVEKAVTPVPFSAP